MSKYDQTCVECHFLRKRLANGDRPVSEELREHLRKGEFLTNYAGWAGNWGCHFDVWGQELGLEESEIPTTATAINRKDKCFFLKFRPGMHFNAAAILQEREAVNREASRDRRHALYGLWIAAMALVCNCCIGTFALIPAVIEAFATLISALIDVVTAVILVLENLAMFL